MLAARPTTYRGSPMRSRLEARYAAHLDAQGLSWTYEPRAYADETGQYLPDFQVDLGRGHRACFVEVRATVERGMLAFDRMPIIWSSDPDALLVVTMPGIPFNFEASAFDRRWWVNARPPWGVRS